MTTIMPQSELTKKAVKWISDKRRDDAGARLAQLIEQAAMRFNLSPKDVEFLQRFFKDQEK
ncbi:MAG: hypothetical protein PHV85_06465 [Desulfovibrionaceae bacterium]|nr:hypothetical protein [Desulfovibrionaceae bacterium]MDD4952174.1 hypothetical protein [Desulfovibrionaceae bacterium]